MLILHHPHSATLVKVKKHRLFNQRLYQQLVDLQAVKHLKLFERLHRRNWPRLRLAKRKRSNQNQAKFPG